MATGTVTYTGTGPFGSRQLAVAKTASAFTIVEESVSNGASNFQINVTVDVSAVKFFWLESDQNVTFETNDGTTPDDTISLLAGEPYVWHATSYDAFQLGTDVTAIFITNASGAAAAVKMFVGYDSTP